LLCGGDIKQAIMADKIQEECCYLIPQITLKQGEQIFLDGLSLADLKEACASQVIEAVPTRAMDWLQWIVDKGCVAGWPVR
jgi:hypothetical protein